MKKIYTIYTYILIPFLLLILTSCGEPEDIVAPQATCDTMATVQNELGSGIRLVLEDGRILSPTNAKIIIASKGEVDLEIGGFPVKEGQQIIIGYALAAGNLSVDNTKSEKKIEVNCIVGVTPKAP